MIKSGVGYAVLVVMTSLLFLLALLTPIVHYGVLHTLSVLGLLVLPFLFFEEAREFVTVLLKLRGQTTWGRTDFYNFLFVFGGAIVTFFLSIDAGLGLGAVVASSLVGIATGLLKPAYAVAAFCGSFVGMACGDTFSYLPLFIAALIAGIVFVLSKYVFNGFGGKLGTIAFSGCVMSVLLTLQNFPVSPIPGWEVGRYLVVVSVVGAVSTFVLSERLHINVVVSSGSVGLIGGLTLPIISPEYGAMLGVMTFCASFAGMSSMKRVKNEVYMIIAALICALVFIYGSPYLGGAGGKLGTIAFGSVISVFGLYKCLKFISKHNFFNREAKN